MTNSNRNRYLYKTIHPIVIVQYNPISIQPTDRHGSVERLAQSFACSFVRFVYSFALKNQLQLLQLDLLLFDTVNFPDRIRCVCQVAIMIIAIK